MPPQTVGEGPPPGAPPAADGLRAAGGENFAALAYRVLGRHFAGLRENEAGARAGEDPEALHDLRVAARRLRVALKFFGPALPGRYVAVARRQLAWLGRALGRRRDLDVQASIAAEFPAAAPAAREAQAAFLAFLDRRRARARRELAAALDSARYRRCTGALQSFLEKGPPRRPNALARQPAAQPAAALLRAAFSGVVRAGRELDRDSSPEELHAFRVRCKKARYQGEFFAEFHGAAFQPLLRRLTALQDALGALQDSLVSQALFAEFLDHSRPRRGGLPRRHEGLALLAGWFIRLTAENRARFPRAWTRFLRKSRRGRPGPPDPVAPEAPANGILAPA